MKKLSKLQQTLLISGVAALAFGGIAAGTTYALFTSEAENTVTVTSGKVSVTSTLEELVTYSGVELTGDASKDTVEKTTVQGTFTNGGTAKIDGTKLTLENMTPGDKVTFNVKIHNASTVKVKYRTKVVCENDEGLAAGLAIKVDGETFKTKMVSAYEFLEVECEDIVIPVEIELPSSAGEEYQGLACQLDFIAEAVQGNAAVTDEAYPAYPSGVTEKDFGENTVAYVDANDKVQYTTSFKDAFANTSVDTIYCKANSSITIGQAHIEFDRDLTIYGNGSNFNRGDISTNGVTGEVDLKLYDTVDLAIWGNAIKTGATLNVYEEGCTVTGTGRSTDGFNLLLTKGSEDTNNGVLNATFKNCKATSVQVGYTSSSQGTTTFENCVFKDCGIGVKMKLKTKIGATRTDTIKDCQFIGCGIATETDDSFAGYAAPISYSNDNDGGKYNGEMTLNAINNTFTDTIGDNGDILLGDTRTGETFNSMTLNLESETEVTVTTAYDKIAKYTSATVVCPAHTA